MCELICAQTSVQIPSAEMCTHVYTQVCARFYKLITYIHTHTRPNINTHARKDVYTNVYTRVCSHV